MYVRFLLPKMMISVFRAIALVVLCFICKPVLYANDQSIYIEELNKRADLYMRNAAYDSAIFYYQKLLPISPNRKDYFNKLLKISSVYRIVRDFDSVYKYQNILEENLLELKENHQNEFFEFLHIKGSVLGDVGNYTEAIEVINNAIETRLLDVVEADTLMAKTYNNLGTYYYYVGDHSSALMYYEKALNLAKKKKDTKSDEVATYYQNIGIMYARKGDLDKALEYLNKNLNINKEILADDDPAMARIYLNLGRTYLVLSQYEKAFQYSKLAEKLYVTKFGSDYASLGLLYLNIGLMRFNQSDHDEAELYYNNALRIYNLNFSNNHPNISKIYNNLGLLYTVRKQNEKALSFFKKSLEMARDPDFIITNLRNIAGAYEKLDQFELADDYFQKAIQKAKISFEETHYEIGQSYKRYGEFLMNTNKSEIALEYYFLALNVFQSNFTGANAYISDVYQLIGNCYLLRNDPDNALKNYQLSLIANDFSFANADIRSNPTIENVLSPINYISILLQKAKALAMFLGDQNKQYLLQSLECYQLAMDGYENLKSNVGEDSKFYLANATRESFDLAFRLLHELYVDNNDEKYIREAFRFAEKGKASVLLSAIKGDDAIKFGGIPEALQLLEKDIKNSISSYESLVYDEKNAYNPNSSKITLWEQKLFNLDQKHDSLLAHFEDKYPSYYSLKLNNSVSGVDDVRSKIDNEQLIIEYVLTDSILFSFVIGKDYLQFKKNRIDSNFFNDLEILRYSNSIDFANHGRNEYKEFVYASNRLYNILFKGLSKIIQNKKLIIVPDGKLGYLPFESLVTKLPSFSNIDYRNLSYLLRSNPVSYTYSSTLLYRTNFKKSNGRSLLAFAPVYDEEADLDSFDERGISINSIFDKLEYAQEEVSEIKNIFDGVVKQGPEASETEFKMTAPNFDIIHLAMHTLIDDENPMQSKMIFTPNADTLNDGFLNTFEIYGLELKAKMAVLSACNTGSGKINRGEGIMSLARGFIYAGVPSIVMTLWEVEDKSGSNIMTLFYKNLDKGMSKDLALQKAKLTYLSKAPQLRSHPYFWAAYVDIGDTEPIVKSFLSRFDIYIYTSILLLAFWFVRYRRKKKLSL